MSSQSTFGNTSSGSLGISEFAFGTTTTTSQLDGQRNNQISLGTTSLISTKSSTATFNFSSSSTASIFGSSSSTGHTLFGNTSGFSNVTVTQNYQNPTFGTNRSTGALFAPNSGNSSNTINFFPNTSSGVSMIFNASENTAHFNMGSSTITGRGTRKRIVRQQHSNNN